MRNGYVLVALAAAMWGVIGIFIHGLYNLGFTAPQVITVRVASAALMLVAYVWVVNRRLLRIHWRHIPYFIGTGIVSIVFFNWCNLITIEQRRAAYAMADDRNLPILAAVILIQVHQTGAQSKPIQVNITTTG